MSRRKFGNDSSMENLTDYPMNGFQFFVNGDFCWMDSVSDVDNQIPRPLMIESLMETISTSEALPPSGRRHDHP